jgi:hypothetical protein
MKFKILVRGGDDLSAESVSEAKRVATEANEKELGSVTVINSDGDRFGYSQFMSYYNGGIDA